MKIVGGRVIIIEGRGHVPDEEAHVGVCGGAQVKHAEGQLQDLRVRLSQEAAKAKEVAARGDRALAAKDAEVRP